VRVHQFGGGRPRRRPRDPNEPQEAASLRSTIMGLLPLLILFILPLLSSLFSGSGEAQGPTMRFDGPIPPHTQHRHTTRLKVDYYLDPAEVIQFTPHKLSQLDKTAEINYVKQLRYGCEQELDNQQRLLESARGWFVQDVEKLNAARNLEMRNCKKLDSMNLARGSY